MDFDLHTHTTYSDGSFMHRMAQTAQREGLEEIGFADHCNVSKREAVVQNKFKMGFNLDQTYQRRRKAINNLRQNMEIKVHDAVEMDYEPQDEDEIKAFLDQAGFDYSLGSVHHLENVNVQIIDYFKNKTRKSQRKLVQKYFEKLHRMIEQEHFDIASHIDLYMRNPALRGYADKEDYEKIAEAFKNSRTIPEINAGRALQGLEKLHPTQEFRQIFVEKGVEFTVGTDSHNPQELTDRKTHLEEKLQELDLEPVRPQTLRN